MAHWNEKPPMLTGNPREDMGQLREYLFRMVKHLEEGDYGSGAQNVDISYDKDGRQILRPGAKGADNAELKKEFQELKSQTVQTLNALRQEISDGDAAVKEYVDDEIADEDTALKSYTDTAILAEDAALKAYVDAKVIWPVGSILATVDSSGPAADLGGVWALLDTGTIGTETVYYFQKTGNGA
jgi:hypothetical protein